MEKNDLLWEKVKSLKKELENAIVNFDNEMQQATQISDFNIFECEREIKKDLANEEITESYAKNCIEYLTRLEEWLRVWNSLSNGIRCIL